MSLPLANFSYSACLFHAHACERGLAHLASFHIEGPRSNVQRQACKRTDRLFGLAGILLLIECCVPALCRAFREIASQAGNKSQDKKVALITKLLVASRDLEPGYIMRALQVGRLLWPLKHQDAMWKAFEQME